MDFEEACSEIDYILENMNPDDVNLIPASVREFFKKHKSVFYKVNLDVTKELREQQLKEETKAFIKILNEKYLYKNNQQNARVFIKGTKKSETLQVRTNEIILYEENKIKRWIKKIYLFFKRNK